MTEADLQAILNQGERRFRMERALRFCLGALGVTLLVSSAVILTSRLVAGASGWISFSLALPVMVTLAVLLISYIRFRPAQTQVAMQLDRRAGTAEHLVTWLELKHRSAQNLSGLERQFLTAQREATLRIATALNPRKLVPFSLPAWARSLWLAFLLLCCAMLVPPQTGATATPIARDSRAASSQRAGGASGAASASAVTHVQQLSPTDEKTIMLKLTDPRLSIEEKAEIVKEVQAMAGEAGKDAVSAELREQWTTIEQEIAQAQKQKKNGSTADTSAQTSGADAEEPNHKLVNDTSPAAIAEYREKALSAARDSFPDVADVLERYYQPPHMAEKNKE